MNYVRSIFAALLIGATSVSTVFCSETGNPSYIKRGADLVASGAKLVKNANHKFLNLMPKKVDNFFIGNSTFENDRKNAHAVFSKGILVSAAAFAVFYKFGTPIADFTQSTASKSLNYTSSLIGWLKSFKRS